MEKRYVNILPLIISLLFTCAIPISGISQSTYDEYINYFKDYDFSKRVVPKIPKKDQQINVIIDTDAKNEIDDQWALALALLSPERFNIVGLVGATFAWGGPESIAMSVREIDTLLKLTDLDGKIPVYPGAHPLRYKYEPSDSEGVDFIIDKAMQATKEEPLWIIGLGAATDIASAYLKEPGIAERIVVFWHLRTKWPDKCLNFNVFGDPHAARLLFDSPIPFVLFDTGTYLFCPMDESEKNVKPYGDIGEYIHNIRIGSEYYSSSKKGFFDLGDIAALLDPEVAYYEEVSCPEVDFDLSYKFNDNKGNILRCYHVDRDKTFQLLYDKLKMNFEK
jgi:inosine-uridine nucleoside N-ribohydrolase